MWHPHPAKLYPGLACLATSVSFMYDRIAATGPAPRRATAYLSRVRSRFVQEQMLAHEVRAIDWRTRLRLCVDGPVSGLTLEDT